jgi:hypothetical protein
VICTGATWPRDLKIPNRDVSGIHFAMEFLQVGVICDIAASQQLSKYADEHEVTSRLGVAKRQLHQCQRQGCHCHRRWGYWQRLYWNVDEARGQICHQLRASSSTACRPRTRQSLAAMAQVRPSCIVTWPLLIVSSGSSEPTMGIRRSQLTLATVSPCLSMY